MKNNLEVRMLQTALKRDAVPGTTLTSFFLDLPDSNAQIHLCAFRDRRWRQLTAMVLPAKGRTWDYTNPPHPRGELILPDYVVRSIRSTLRHFGIRHLIGIRSESKVPQGVLLTPLVSRDCMETRNRRAV